MHQRYNAPLMLLFHGGLLLKQVGIFVPAQLQDKRIELNLIYNFPKIANVAESTASYTLPQILHISKTFPNSTKLKRNQLGSQYTSAFPTCHR